MSRAFTAADWRAGRDAALAAFMEARALGWGYDTAFEYAAGTLARRTMMPLPHARRTLAAALRTERDTPTTDLELL